MATKQTEQLIEMAQVIERDIREIRRKLRRPLDAEVERAQLTGPQISVMRTVFFSDGLSLKEICSRIGLSHSTVSGIVDRLAARGMLERSVNAADRRYSNIAVSRAVRDFMQTKAPGIIAQPLVRALKKATPSERKEILKGLGTLRHLLGLAEDRTPNAVPTPGPRTERRSDRPSSDARAKGRNTL
jgi:DNA-binding MarR family transcriptional regulator